MLKQVLALRGEGGYRQYRIPAMAVTHTGRVIAIYDGRADLDDLPGPINLLIRTSDDNGVTWSEQKVFRSGVGIEGFGDASILIAPSGRIFVFYQRTQLAGFFESESGCELSNPMIVQVGLSISDDDGKTWNHRIITSQIKDLETLGIFASSGMGSQISNGKYKGRLLQTFLLRTKNELIAAIGYSDDNGDTWKLGARIPGGNESKAIGLNDGTILVHSRATPYRIKSRSIDGGETLESSVPDYELSDPSDNGSLTLLSDGSLICTHNHDKNLRRYTVLKRSIDNGESWPESVVIEFGSSAYSTSVELSNGNIGVLYERNGYNELLFCEIQMAELQPKKAIPALFLSVALRYIKPIRNSTLTGIGQIVEVPDLSPFGDAQGKEIGEPITNSGSIKIFSRDEYDLILDTPTPGLHVGDEMRFSLSFINSSQITLHGFALESDFLGVIYFDDEVAPGKLIKFMDLRKVIIEEDLKKGTLEVVFTWSAANAHGEKLIQVFSCSTGERL